MAQKVNKPAPTPTIIITITLPEEDKLLRTGQLLIQRGELATLRQFEYTNLEDIMSAVQDSTTWLMQVEANPPDVTPAAPRPQAAAPSEQQPAEADAADEASDAQDAEASADPAAPASTPETVQADQPHLL